MSKLDMKIKIGEVYLRFINYSSATRYEAIIDSENKDILACLDTTHNAFIINNMINDKIKIVRNRYTDDTLKDITIYTDYTDYKKDVTILAGVIAGLQYNK